MAKQPWEMTFEEYRQNIAYHADPTPEQQEESRLLSEAIDEWIEDFEIYPMSTMELMHRRVLHCTPLWKLYTPLCKWAKLKRTCAIL